MRNNNNENEVEENGNNFLMVPVSRPLHLDTTMLPSRPTSPYTMVGLKWAWLTEKAYLRKRGSRSNLTVRKKNITMQKKIVVSLCPLSFSATLLWNTNVLKT
ncbi:Protein CBG27032 [Caenorhabditis briggsae]|uniref:Protein CBG27032 n=1 Tax=Caenorhabditis briggsae TaxID=6238 RepID=B6IM96_CAEBR|nr:Protein CBG27032 [Caenorhabditis briggsae]CAS01026.1 Protein CBG27032 [Caenorhabditis briggsae]